MKNKPLVTICCTAYNHEAYIADCLEGFLMQKTNFPFEILIHDDASTDRTADIIREYEKKYPDIIRVIYQTENQYSKGVKISQKLFDLSEGKYIAFCEGDDFWNEPLKLQKQFDFMEAHPDYSFSLHDRYVLNYFSEKYSAEKIFFSKNWNSDGRTVAKMIIQRNFVFATQTLFFRYSSFLKCKDKYIRDCKNAPMSDVQLMFHLAMTGKVYYIPERLATYRIARGSVSMFENEGVSQARLEKTLKYMEKIANMNDVGDWWKEGIENNRSLSQEDINLTSWQHFLYRVCRILNGYYFKFYMRQYYYRYMFRKYMKSSPSRRCRIRVSDIFV